MKKVLRNQGVKDAPWSLLSASVQSVAAGLSVQLLLFISGPIVARILGVEGRGYLAGLNVWPFLLASLGNLGIPAACTYYLSQYPERAPQVLGEACRLALVQTVILTGALVVILLFWSQGKPPEVSIALYPVLVTVPSILGHQYALAVLQGQRRFKVFSALRLLPVIFYTLSLMLLFMLGECRLLPVVMIGVLAQALAGIISITVAVRRVRIDWRGVPDMRYQFITFGLRGHLGAISPVDTLPIDQAAVAIFLSPAELGLYAVACAFTNLPRFVAYSAGIVAYPGIANCQEIRSAWRLIWRFFWGVTVFNLLCGMLLIMAMHTLLPLLFGTEFSSAVPIARILLVGSVIMSSRRILGEGLRGLGYPGISTVAEISMYPWLAIGGSMLMLWYGVQGLAAALVVGYSISLIVVIAAIFRTTSGIGCSLMLLKKAQIVD